MNEILAAVEKAQKSLRSTQENWHEECLFDADEYLSEAIRLIKTAPQSVQPTIESGRELPAKKSNRKGSAKSPRR